MTIWIVVLMALLGGFVQGVTGFGGGIVMMMVFPMLFPLTQAAGINGAILVFLNSTMVYVYRKHINIKMVLPVFLFSIIVSTITIKVAAGAAPLIIKKMFGGFLLLLAIYYLFIKKDGRPSPGLEGLEVGFGGKLGLGQTGSRKVGVAGFQDQPAAH